MRRTFTIAAIPFALSIGAGAMAGGTTHHRTDGDFSEWQGQAPVATDPAGDSSALFDITSVWLNNEGERLYMRFDTTVTRNLPAGSFSDGQIFIEIRLPTSQRLVINLRNRSAVLDPGGPLRWTGIDFTCAPSYAANEFELQIDLGALGVEQGDTIDVLMYGADPLDSGPITYTMAGAPVTPARRSAERLPRTSFRVASINTLFGGLAGGSQQLGLGNLISAVGADIYCFQEEWENSAAHIENLFNDLDPAGDGAEWTAHKVDGQVIVARGAIVGLPAFNSRYGAAAVEFAPGRWAVIVSAHLKCCGFIGSPEDNDRISQASQIATTVNFVRNSVPGSPFYTYRDAPVVVIGDYNLVGSREPVAVLESDAGLTRWILPHLIGEGITTWRSDTSSFWPGTLDLVMHGDRVAQRNGFVLDSAQLNPQELTDLGLNGFDSRIASDHLMLVADFGVLPPADITRDCVVDTADLEAVIQGFGATGGGPADLNGDGIVDTADLGALIRVFGAVCE